MLLFIGGKSRALLGELAVIFLHEALLHRCEFQLVAGVIDLTDAVKESLIEVYLVVGLVQQGDCLLRHLGELGSAESLHIMVEDSRHAFQNRREILERKDGVVEIGSGAVHDNRVDCAVLLLDAGLDGGDEIGCGDFVERGDFILCVVRLKEWILSFGSHGGRGVDGEEQSSSGQNG